MFDIKRSYNCDGCFKKLDREEDINHVNVSVWRRIDGEPSLVSQPRMFCDACLNERSIKNATE